MKVYILVGIVILAIVALLATNKKLQETLKNIYKIEIGRASCRERV